MRTRTVVLLLIGLVCQSAVAHVGAHPSVHDTAAAIVERLKATYRGEFLVNLTLDQVLEELTEEERRVLGTEHLTFRVNTPVEVYVIRDMRLGKEPFWLEEQGFEQTPLRVTAVRREFDIWKKTFEAGVVGLGVNSLTGGQEHYFVAIKPVEATASLEVTEVYPGGHTLGTFEVGALAYADDDETIAEAPGELIGLVLIRGLDSRRRDAQLVNLFRATPFPASERPDHVVLTWSGDPRTTQTIQWRTNESVEKGLVQYLKKAEFNRFKQKPPHTVTARTVPIATPNLVNDPMMNRHTTELTGLEPGTAYVYSVGDGSANGWTELAEFTTAPAGTAPFSFIYMGDAQNGLERWGTLVHNAFRDRPDAAFYLMAGDLVNRGAERDDWDSLFENAKGIFDRRPLVPVLGNHEYQGGDCKLYLDLFTLPTNGATTIAPEKSYAFTYSNALFVILDSNLPPETQADWLEKQLAASESTWKIVSYHHPAYSSGPNRDNPEVRNVWGAIFDKHHVDLALQGHDHAYLRTYPMRDQKRAVSPAEGTIYIVSVSGTKFYEQGQFDYAEFGMTNVSTYQVLDLQIDGNRLLYRAYDIDGNLRDSFEITK
jgi:hypothetical protein